MANNILLGRRRNRCELRPQVVSPHMGRLLRRVKYQNAAAATRTIRTIHQYCASPPSPLPGVPAVSGEVEVALVVARADEIVRNMDARITLMWFMGSPAVVGRAPVELESEGGS